MFTNDGSDSFNPGPDTNYDTTYQRHLRVRRSFCQTKLSKFQFLSLQRDGTVVHGQYRSNAIDEELRSQTHILADVFNIQRSNRTNRKGLRRLLQQKNNRSTFFYTSVPLHLFDPTYISKNFRVQYFPSKRRN